MNWLTIAESIFLFCQFFFFWTAEENYFWSNLLLEVTITEEKLMASF